MIIILNKTEIALLINTGINFEPKKEYSDDEAFDLLDKVYEREVFFVQDGNSQKAAAYADLADKIQEQIPD